MNINECFEVEDTEIFECSQLTHTNLFLCRCCESNFTNCDSFYIVNGFYQINDSLKCNDLVNICNVNIKNDNITSCVSKCKNDNISRTFHYNTKEIWENEILKGYEEISSCKYAIFRFICFVILLLNMFIILILYCKHEWNCKMKSQKKGQSLQESIEPEY